MSEKNNKSAPTVFISYSHDTKDHKAWVADLGRRLREKGIEVTIDQWDTELGDDLPKFMERGVSESDRVLMICTEPYVRKVDDGKGGAGYEAMIVTAELVRDQGLNKFIPVIRQTAKSRVTPVCLGTRKYVDLSIDRDFDEGFQELIETIHKVVASKKPPLGPNPFLKNAPSAQKQQEEKALAHQFAQESREPAIAYGTAKTLILAQDLVGWRKLVQSLANSGNSELLSWKKSRQPSAPTSINEEEAEPVWAYVAEGVACYDALLASLLAAAETNDPNFAGQLGWIDLVLEPKGWEKSGNTFWTEFPRTILFALHTRVGSMLMQSATPELALRLLATPLSDPYNSSETAPIFLTHGIMGWQEVFARNCTHGWGFLNYLIGKTTWLREIWSDEEDQRAALVSYFMFASFLEYCREAGKTDRPFEPDKWHLDTPQDHCLAPKESLRRGYALLIDQRSLLLKVLERNGLNEATVRNTWPKWMTAIHVWLGQVYRRHRFRFDTLPHAKLADDLYRDPYKL